MEKIITKPVSRFANPETDPFVLAAGAKTSAAKKVAANPNTPLATLRALAQKHPIIVGTNPAIPMLMLENAADPALRWILQCYYQERLRQVLLKAPGYRRLMYFEWLRYLWSNGKTEASNTLRTLPASISHEFEGRMRWVLRHGSVSPDVNFIQGLTKAAMNSLWLRFYAQIKQTPAGIKEDLKFAVMILPAEDFTVFAALLAITEGIEAMTEAQYQARLEEIHREIYLT